MQGESLAIGSTSRGRELGYALTKLGHRVQQVSAIYLYKQLQDKTLGHLDAIVLGGTWHQIQGASGYPIQIAELADSIGVPCLWWYGSNGCPHLSFAPDPVERKAEHDRTVEAICRRHFMTVIAPYCVDVYEKSGVPRDKMRVCPTLFDSDLFHVPSAHEKAGRRRLCWDWNIPYGGFFMGTVSNTPNSKGGDDTLRAMALLAKEMPDLHYFLHTNEPARLSKRKAIGPKGNVGKSEFDVLEDTKMLAAQLGLRDRVHFRGMRVDRRYMPWSYLMMDLYVSPSKAENLGQPFIESQLCGIPLVTYKGFSFDYCACPHSATQYEPCGTVQDDWGLVIPETKPEDLADAIRKGRHIAETQGMADKTHDWAAEKFDHRNATKMVDAIHEYRGMMAR